MPTEEYLDKLVLELHEVKEKGILDSDSFLDKVGLEFMMRYLRNAVQRIRFDSLPEGILYVLTPEHAFSYYIGLSQYVNKSSQKPKIHINPTKEKGLSGKGSLEAAIEYISGLRMQKGREQIGMNVLFYNKVAKNEFERGMRWYGLSLIEAKNLLIDDKKHVTLFKYAIPTISPQQDISIPQRRSPLEYPQFS